MVPGSDARRGAADEVNSVQHNHPGLLEPISAEETLTPGEPAQDPLL